MFITYIKNEEINTITMKRLVDINDFLCLNHLIKMPI